MDEDLQTIKDLKEKFITDSNTLSNHVIVTMEKYG